jgi:hypothetical protein
VGIQCITDIQISIQMVLSYFRHVNAQVMFIMTSAGGLVQVDIKEFQNLTSRSCIELPNLRYLGAIAESTVIIWLGSTVGIWRDGGILFLWIFFRSYLRIGCCGITMCIRIFYYKYCMFIVGRSMAAAGCWFSERICWTRSFWTWNEMHKGRCHRNFDLTKFN